VLRRIVTVAFLCRVQIFLLTYLLMCNAVRLWDIAGRRCVVRYVGHSYPVHCIDAWYVMEHFLAFSWSKCWKGDSMQGVKPTVRPKIWWEEVWWRAEKSAVKLRLCCHIPHSQRWSHAQVLPSVLWFGHKKIIPDMTYNVFGGTLNLAQSINIHRW